MIFEPENPAKPQDLYATFNSNNQLNGLIYENPDGVAFSRVRGDWYLLEGAANPINAGAWVVFVSPNFIMEYDARMAYREYLPQEEVQEKFGVKPDMDLEFLNS